MSPIPSAPSSKKSKRSKKQADHDGFDDDDDDDDDDDNKIEMAKILCEMPSSPSKKDDLESGDGDDTELDDDDYFFVPDAYDTLLNNTKSLQPKTIVRFLTAHNMNIKFEIPDLYTEDYVGLCFADQKTLETMCSPPESLLLAFDLCKPSRRAFSPYAMWSAHVCDVFRFVRSIQNPVFLTQMLAARFTCGAVSHKHISLFMRGKSLKSEVVHAVIACMVRTIRVVVRSECRLFALASRLSSDDLWPKLRDFDCVCIHGGQNCKYVRELQSKGSCSGKVICEKFDYGKELKKAF